MQDDRTEADRQAFSQFLDLWSKENPIKTTKLQVLLAVNGILVSVVQLNGGFVDENLPLYLAGALVSLIWTLSIGRTALFQKIWRRKLEAIAERHQGDVRFEIFDIKEARNQLPLWLRIFGGVSSKYYLLCAPFVFFLLWLFAGIYVVSGG